MTYKPTSGNSDPDIAPGKGLRGPDKQQDEEWVQRTQDTDGPPARPAPTASGNIPRQQHATQREQAQSGADVRAPTDFGRASTDLGNEGMAEGLRRARAPAQSA
jgi:hypothetical protein